MQKKFSPQTHELIYFVGLSAMAIGLPLSAFLMGSSTFLLAANWLLEGDFKNKWKRFVSNKTALILTSLFGIHLLGLTYTSDFNYAANDLKIKLPLLILPFLFSTMPMLTKEKFNWLMGIFIFSVFCGTMVSLGVYLGIVPTKKLQLDIRDISIFISHIRFSLMICLAIFMLVHYTLSNKNNLLRMLLIIIALWFISFLMLIESLTGFFILFAVSAIFLLRKIIMLDTLKRKILAAAALCLLILSPALYMNQLHSEFARIDEPRFSNLETTTLNGATYMHDTISRQTENGHYIGIYISLNELENAWKKRSKLAFYGHDLKGNELRFTIIRFLTSKNLRKDIEGLNSLTNEEIEAIERGIANVYYMNKWSLKGRLHQTWWEYMEYKQKNDVRAHSSTQRLLFWKAAVSIIKQDPFIGVGTGDVQRSFDAYYEKTKSPLEKEYRLRSHNQYLTIAVALGFAGLCWFLFGMLYPLFKEGRWNDTFYIIHLTIILCSFINEDTLESQAGVVFFSFFTCVYLFLRPINSKRHFSK